MVIIYGENPYPWLTYNGWSMGSELDAFENETIKEIIIIDEIYLPLNSDNFFGGYKELNTIKGMENIRTGQVESMYLMFYKLPKINTNLDFSSFDTSNVFNMGYMFCNSGITELDLSKFNTSKVSIMRYMFYGCDTIESLDLSNFDTSKVDDMDHMFYGCSNLKSVNLSNFDTSKVNDMDYMFYGCSNLESVDLRNFDMSNVKYMYRMFANCTNLKEVLVGKDFKIPEGVDKEDIFKNSGVSDFTYVSE